MKAAAITRLGAPEVIETVDVPLPEAGPGYVLVKVKAVGLNWLDVMARTQDFGLKLPHIGGSDISGVVDKAATGSPFLAGTPVLINPSIPCNQCEPCKVGDRECQFVRILGLHTAGGYGEYVSVPEAQVFAKPQSISFEQAAAFPLDFLTAWRMLVTRAKLLAGEHVFVWGATGALGVAAIQLAHHLGATVIAAVGDSKHASALKQLGADTVINHRTDDIASLVKSGTGESGADIVFESVGQATMRRSVEIVRAGGRIVICGTKSGNTAEIDFSDVYYKQVSILGSRMGTATDFREVYAMLAKNLIDVHVGRVLPISQISEAHHLLENRDFVGKIVLTRNGK